MAASDSKETMWNLCLQSREGRKVIKISSSKSTKDLYEEASNAFAGSTVSSLKYGFPPKSLDSSDVAAISSMLQNQERIQVELSTAATASSKSSKSTKKNSKNIAASASASTEAAASGTRPKSKRAAAKAATEAMPEVIKAQDRMLREQQKQATKKRTRTTAKPANNINNSNTNKKAKKPTTPKKFTAGPGRRLNDGAPVAGIAASAFAAGKRSRRNANGGDVERQQGPSDYSEALIGALNHKGTMGTVLRKGMKNAVQASYETTRTFSRLAAIQSKSYQMNHSGATNKLHIEYKGTVDKTKTVEDVDCLPRDVLFTLLDSIYTSNREALRPENFARLSPRTLWSLVYHFPTCTTIEDMYKELFTENGAGDKDWSFLRRRAEQLSEKALENARQQKGDDDGEDGEIVDEQAAADAVAAVEHAMEHLTDYERTERQSRQAQAAMARLQGAASSSNGSDDAATNDQEWKLVTPNEPDRDELLECIQASPPERTSGAPTPSILITRLMKDCQIHNWRELAIVSDDDVDDIGAKLDVDVETVKLWIDKAQEKSVPEIMVEICDDHSDFVDILIEHVNISTPKDLAAWHLIPQMLHRRLQQGINASNKNDDEESRLEQETFKNVTVAELGSYCNRAHQLLQDSEHYDFLEWYGGVD